MQAKEQTEPSLKKGKQLILNSNGCPYCHQDTWVRLPRSFLQKVLHPRHNLCFCRECRKKFWRPVEF